ncbi:protein of unknown function (plasmid) [Thiomonas sp. Bio17B3]|nr:protein of unknown function [Thiomonas sp. Sup16B3]VDY11295.1 protein of unknown function [Thiomonas sp. Bio17B3]
MFRDPTLVGRPCSLGIHGGNRARYTRKGECETPVRAAWPSFSSDYLSALLECVGCLLCPLRRVWTRFVPHSGFCCFFC